MVVATQGRSGVSFLWGPLGVGGSSSCSTLHGLSACHTFSPVTLIYSLWKLQTIVFLTHPLCLQAAQFQGIHLWSLWMVFFVLKGQEGANLFSAAVNWWRKSCLLNVSQAEPAGKGASAEGRARVRVSPLIFFSAWVGNGEDWKSLQRLWRPGSSPPCYFLTLTCFYLFFEEEQGVRWIVAALGWHLGDLISFCLLLNWTALTKLLEGWSRGKVRRLDCSATLPKWRAILVMIREVWYSLWLL